MLTPDGTIPTDVASPTAVLGVWSGGQPREQVRDARRRQAPRESGPWVQVSRLGNPLFNEVIVPIGKKDDWNREQPGGRQGVPAHVQHPELAELLPVLYPGVFPNLAGLGAARADLVAILLTGIPSGIIPGFQNFTGTTQADMLRLNIGDPADATAPNPFGLVGGDLAGFPNGRRLADDIVAIELRAIAGATYPLVDRPTRTRPTGPLPR